MIFCTIVCMKNRGKVYMVGVCENTVEKDSYRRALLTLARRMKRQTVSLF